MSLEEDVELIARSFIAHSVITYIEECDTWAYYPDLGLPDVERICKRAMEMTESDTSEVDWLGAYERLAERADPSYLAGLAWIDD